jgi:hypothetical protein
MIRGLVLCLSLLCLLGCGPQRGDAAPPAGSGLGTLPAVATQPAGIPLDQVLAKYAAALGGRDRLLAVKTVRMSGRMTTSRDVKGAPITIEKQRQGGEYLRRLLTGGFTVIQAIDGNTAWEVDPGMDIPKPRVMSDLDASRFRHRLDIEGPLVDYRAKGNQVELVGKQKVDAGEAYRLKVRYKDGGISYFLIDTKTFLPLQILDVVNHPRGMFEVQTSLKDFRPVGGVLWPFSETTVLPRFEQQITWDKVEADVPLADGEFRMPV